MFKMFTWKIAPIIPDIGKDHHILSECAGFISRYNLPTTEIYCQKAIKWYGLKIVRLLRRVRR